MHPCTPHDRTEGAFKRTRDRQPKVVLQRAGPPWLSFSHCFCDRRRARGRIINAIFPLVLSLFLTLPPIALLSRLDSLVASLFPSLSHPPLVKRSTRSWTMAIECTSQNEVPPLPLSLSPSLFHIVNYASRRCRGERTGRLLRVAILFPLLSLLFCLDYARETTRLTSSRTQDAIMTGARIFINASAASLHRGSRLECLTVPAR